MKYLSNDELERYWFQYKSEGEPHGSSLEQFCRIHGISYKALDNWRRQTKNRIFPVEVEGYEPDGDHVSTPVKSEEVSELMIPSKFISCKHRQAPSKPCPVEVSEEKVDPTEVDEQKETDRVRIMVSIRMTNGPQVYQKNLNYGQLRLLGERDWRVYAERMGDFQFLIRMRGE